MNENSGLEQTFAPVDQSAPQAVGTLEPPISPKKSGKGKFIAGAAVICAVAAVAVGIKLFSTPKDPKSIVEDAFASTLAAQEKNTKEIYKKIPAIQPLFEGRRGALSTEFDLTIKSVEDVPYASFISAIVADAGIRGSVSSDPESKTSAISTSVYLKDAPLVDLSLFVSPDVATGSLPTFSDTILAFNPSTFAGDYERSALNSLSPMDEEELKVIQDVITGYVDYFSSIQTMSYDKMLEDLKPIFKKAFANAEYTYDEQNKVYVVNIPNEDLKTAITEYYKYIYFESEMASSMKTMMNTLISAQSDMTYEQLMAESINMINESIPDMTSVLTLNIDNGLITNAKLVCTPLENAQADAALSETKLNSISYDMAFGATTSTGTFVIDMTNVYEENINFKMDIKAGMEKDVYAMDMVLDLTSKEVTLNMPMTMSIGADGAYLLNADVAAKSMDEDVSFGLSFNGTADFKNDVLTLNLPGSRIYGGSPSIGTGAVTYDFTYVSAPLTEKPSAPEGSTALFDMSLDEIALLAEEFSAGAETLSGRLYSLLMG